MRSAKCLKNLVALLVGVEDLKPVDPDSEPVKDNAHTARACLKTGTATASDQIAQQRLPVVRETSKDQSIHANVNPRQCEKNVYGLLVQCLHPACCRLPIAPARR